MRIWPWSRFDELIEENLKLNARCHTQCNTIDADTIKLNKQTEEIHRLECRVAELQETLDTSNKVLASDTLTIDKLKQRIEDLGTELTVAQYRLKRQDEAFQQFQEQVNMVSAGRGAKLGPLFAAISLLESKVLDDE